VITFLARVKCDRPGCDASKEVPVYAYIDCSSGRDRAVIEASEMLPLFHELADASGREWVECAACYADPDRFREAAKP
jgi:hypothetical protein